MSIFFRPISTSNSCKRLASVNKPISYSTYRQSFKKSFRDIVGAWLAHAPIYENCCLVSTG